MALQVCGPQDPNCPTDGEISVQTPATPTTTPSTGEACVETRDGQYCPPASSNTGCSPWELTNDRAQCIADMYTQEALNIAGADVNVYKLLGIHEQGKLLDLTGDGAPVSGGAAPGYPASNAFDVFLTEWHSLQVGSAVLASAYIGYDFGVYKIPNGRVRYGIEASIRQHITLIKIKQSSNPSRRATKVRVERSDDGQKWFGVAAITLPNDDCLNAVGFSHSAPMRYWRLRPLEFTGGAADFWAVQALEMHDYQATALDNIQDKIFMENRNRDHATDPIKMKGYYDLIDLSTELSRFGIEIPSQVYTIKVNFNAAVATLGRPVVIGDILELPSETQYTPTLQPIKKYLEVTDVAWDATSFTPGWKPTLQRLTAMPALATEETQKIFGDLVRKTDESGLFDKDDGNNPLWQDIADVDQTIFANAKAKVPERGSEGSNTIREFSAEELAQAAEDGFPHLNRMGFNPKGLYVEDAIPSNGVSYTEGTTFPTSPVNGDYHRMTYTGLAGNVPPRLYRYSTTKGRWIYLETDRRKQYNEQSAVLSEYLGASGAQPSENFK